MRVAAAVFALPAPGRHAHPAAMTSEPSAPAGPALQFTPHTRGSWPFHLVSARIDWPSGASSQGWGRDEDAELAQRKAMAEAVERHAYTTLPATLVRGHAADVSPRLEPDRLVRYSREQAGEPGFPFVPYDPAQERWWAQAIDVESGAKSWVAADFVCTARAFADADRSRLITHASSSGCASGARLAEAIARGTFELVERDAFMRHWFAQRPGDTLIAASLPTWCAARLAELRACGCEAGIQCLTLGAHPAFLAWAQHPRLHFTCVGASAGCDAEEALRTALSEAETMALAWLGAGHSPEMQPQQVLTPADHGALYARPEFFRSADAVLRAPAGALRFADAAVACASTPTELYERLRRRGHPPHWVDLSLAEAANALDGEPLYTVRTLAPGLVPIAFGWNRQAFGMADVAPGGRFPHPFN
jgi:ribosomal protein S12 methylthiotransferase accessory factor